MKRKFKKTISFAKLLFISIGIFVLVSIGIYYASIFRQRSFPSELIAWKWMDFAMQIVRDEKPTPPEAARFYAYVASVYSDVYEKTKNIDQASLATKKIITIIYPTWEEEVNKTYLAFIPNKTASVLTKDSQSILGDYKIREQTEEANKLVWDEVIPKGEGKWIKQNKMPYSPMAGDWKRWILQQNEVFTVPLPPVIGSKEELNELRIVKEAIAKRDEAWNKKIIYWQGIPGTETPSGIWQNILHDESKELHLNELTYSRYQKILAQSLADSFMECWKVKYTYWTARPSMRIPGIITSMPDPPFPSYVSGHSTVSSTAAYVLGYLIPSKKEKFLSLAEEARDSRLYAGIHFQVDNEQGFLLGEKIGEKIVLNLSLNQ